MKRIFGAVTVVLLLVGILPTHNAAAASTDDFTISSYDMQFELSRDSESRSVLKTTETITAQFPDADQNHGIERAIPSEYAGHTTSLVVNSVTNGDGQPLHYTTKDANDLTTLRIGDADTYVHGAQTYKLIYTQRDVTQFYSDTNRDEWYWDTNGTDWEVPIDHLSVTMKIDPTVNATLDSEPGCYGGAYGASDACTITATGDDTYSASADNLSAGDNITVVFGFKPGTFAGYQMSTADFIALLLGLWQVISVILAVVLGIIFGAVYNRKKYRKAEEQPIAVEYIPRRDTSVTVASQVITGPRATFTAQLIDLAVRHYISIVQTKEKSFWTGADYTIVIETNLDELFDEEKEIIRDMFNGLPKVGERIALSSLRENMSYSSRTLDNDKKLKKLVEGVYGIREKTPHASRFFYGWTIVMGIIAVVTLSIPLAIFALVLWGFGIFIKPLTDKGLELRRYMLGLDMYIKAAEAERLKFLQGPDTAEKVGYAIDTENVGDMIKLYERVLPYAILFGREKQWSKRLGDYYGQAQSSPTWYTQPGVFNAALFASTLQTFSGAATYSSGASSSSTGGSGGGGFSGGGGGGGGGGGW